MTLRQRIKAARARHRLTTHMYDRLVAGGTPDCPCRRCGRDRAFLEQLGEPWNHPEQAAWWRDFERTLGRAGGAR